MISVSHPLGSDQNKVSGGSDPQIVGQDNPPGVKRGADLERQPILPSGESGRNGGQAGDKRMPHRQGSADQRIAVPGKTSDL